MLIPGFGSFRLSALKAVQHDEFVNYISNCNYRPPHLYCGYVIYDLGKLLPAVWSQLHH